LNTEHNPDPISIPMSSPDLSELERQAVRAVLDTPNLSMGNEIQAFEEIFRDYTGLSHAIGINSGTAGLHLCLRAAGIGAAEGSPGDLVITTPFSFVASTNVLLYEQAVPVFVDVDPLTGNIDPAQVRQAASDLMDGGANARRWLPRHGAGGQASLKAILPVDVFGQPADMDPILEVAEQYGLKVIEDSCEALGAEYRGRKAGTLGDFGVFAFYPNKQITTGEGGMIVTDDSQAADKMRALRNQGRAPGDTWLQHTYLGYNYRLDEMSAVLGRIQMQRLPELLAKRQQVADWYAERIGEIPGIQAPQIVPTTSRASWFVYVVQFAPEIVRDEMVRALAAHSVPARPYFAPIHLQPYLVEKFGFQPGDYPATEELGRRGLALPFSGVMSEDQVDRVCRVLQEILQE
jgi:perosamine synthetase